MGLDTEDTDTEDTEAPTMHMEVPRDTWHLGHLADSEFQSLLRLSACESGLKYTQKQAA